MKLSKVKVRFDQFDTLLNTLLRSILSSSVGKFFSGILHFSHNVSILIMKCIQRQSLKRNKCDATRNES